MENLINKFSLTVFAVVVSLILSIANMFSQTQSFYFMLLLSVIFIFIAWVGDRSINYQINYGHKYEKMWCDLKDYANLIDEKGGNAWEKSRLTEYMDKLEKEIMEEDKL